jgi:hypothetical protein
VGFVRRHQRWVLASGVVFVVFVAFVLWWFQPQKLFIDKTVNEPAPAAPVVLAQGAFQSGEHHTEGTARVLRQFDGRRTLRLSGLRTSNGPVLKVWLTAADAGASNGEIKAAVHLDLGGLKGNIGNQNYAIPATADTGRYRAAVIWCARFHVSFGTAPLAAVEEGA